MKPDDMFVRPDEAKVVKEWTREELRELWPQARGELLGFARAMRARSGITAAQLEMSIFLADKEYERAVADHKVG